MRPPTLWLRRDGSLFGLLALLILSSICYLPSSAAAQGGVTPTWQVQGVATNTYRSNYFVITPLRAVGNNGNLVVLGVPLRGSTTNGLFTTNLLNGAYYRVEVWTGYNVYSFTNFFDANTTGAVDGGDPLYRAFGQPQDRGVYAPSLDYVQALFLPKYGGRGTNEAFYGTFKLPDGGGSVGYVWTKTGTDGAGAWQARSGGGGAATNFYPGNFTAWGTTNGSNVVNITGQLTNFGKLTTNAFDTAGAATLAANAATNGYPWGALYDALNTALNATNGMGIASGYSAFVPTNRFDPNGAALAAALAATNALYSSITNSLNVNTQVVGTLQLAFGSALTKVNSSSNLVAAVAGTDYLTPSGNGSGLTGLSAGNLSGIVPFGNFSTNVLTGTNQPFTPGQALVITGTNSTGQPVVKGTNWPSGSGGGGTVTNWYFNVRDFGAVGDFNTDDYSAISNAIVAANASSIYGSAICFPPGVYRVSTNLPALAKTIKLFGALSMVDADPSWDGGAYPIYSGSVLVNTNLASGILNITATNALIEDLALVGATNATAAALLTVTNNYYGNRIDLNRVSFHGGFIGFEKDVGALCRIHNCLWENQVKYQAFGRNTQFVDAGDDTYDSCQFYGRQPMWASVYYESSGGLKILNSKFNYAGTGNGATNAIHILATGASANPTLTNTSIGIIRGCSIESFTGDGILLESANGSLWDGWKISDNQFSIYSSRASNNCVRMVGLGNGSKFNDNTVLMGGTLQPYFAFISGVTNVKVGDVVSTSATGIAMAPWIGDGTAVNVRSDDFNSGEDYISGLLLNSVAGGTKFYVTPGKAYVPNQSAFVTVSTLTTNTPTIAAGKWYSVYLAQDTSANPTLTVSQQDPSTLIGMGTARYASGGRYLGSFLTDSGGKIWPFRTVGSGPSLEVYYLTNSYSAPFRALSGGTAASFTEVSFTNVVPRYVSPSIFVNALLNFTTTATDSASVSLSQDGISVNGGLNAYVANTSAFPSTLIWQPITSNTSIFYNVAHAGIGVGENVYLDVVGYRFLR